MLVAAALALGACGGDDGGNGETTGAEAQQTTGTTETRERTGTTGTDRTKTREDRTSTSEKGDDSGGGNKGSGSGGGGSKGGNDEGSTSQPAAQPGNVKKVAQTVCNSFLPKQIENDLKKDERSEEDVARDYSKGFPDKQQKAAYEGCLAGLKAR